MSHPSYLTNQRSEGQTRLTRDRIAILLSNRYQISACKPRTPATLNLFSAFDGNILGGILLGFGMALTGACPGTLIPQLAAGAASGPPVLLGGLLGGILYSRFGQRLLGNVRNARAMAQPTVFQRLDVTQGRAMAVYETLCLGAIAAFSRFFPDQRGLLVPSVVGGVLIGASQVTSLLLTGGTLGISSAYEQLGHLFWWAVDGGRKPRPSIKATAFALGTALGSWGFLRVSGFASAAAPTLHVGTARAVFGGVLLTFGARIAGGCTSGHGISGMSQLSVASIVTVAAMFGSGIALSTVVG